MTRLILVLALVGWASPLSAQTHPCDVVYPNNPAVGSPVKFGFCVPQTDAQYATAYKVYLDFNTTTPIFTGALTATGGPNASGFVHLVTPPIAVVQGSHSFQSATVNPVGEGAKSAAYPFVVIGLPVAPSNAHIEP